MRIQENKVISGKEKSVLFASGCTVILCGVLFAAFDIRSRPFEYDEIWTLLQYTELPLFDIFRNLETPNNHPLHSLLCKGAVALFGGSDCFSLRLTAFLAGLLLAGALCAVLTNSRKLTVVLPGCAFLAFNPCFLEYLTTARGYTLQMLFVFLLCMLLFRNDGSHSMRNAGLIFLSGAAACLSITSGLVFVCAAFGAWFLTWFPIHSNAGLFRKHRGPLLGGVLFLVFALVWYGMNYSVIARGQTFGVSLFREPGNYFNAMRIAVLDTGILPLALLSAVGLFTPSVRKISVFALSFTGLALLSSVVTFAGPPRVYLPAVGILAVSAAYSADALLERISVKPLRIAGFAACVLLPAWNAGRLPDYRAIDWRNSIDALFAFPRTEFPVFPPPEGVRLKMLYPEIRSFVQDTNLSALLLCNCGDALPAVNPVTAELESFPLSAPAKTITLSKHVTIRRYPLRALKPDDVFTPDTLLFAAVRYGADRSFGAVMRPEWKLVNQVFFPQQVFLLVKKAPAESPAFFCGIREKTHGAIRFFRLDKSSPRN